MATNHAPKLIYEFGLYRLDVAERLLLRNGETIQLQPKVFELLSVLIQHHGHLVEKDELMKLVWPDAFVEEANLANNISILRKTLSENGERLIETVPKRGYRFVALVTEQTADRGVAGDFSTSAEIEQSKAEVGEASVRGISQLISRRPRFAALLLIVLSVGPASAISSWWIKRQPVAPIATIKTIAVLPFKPLAAGSRDEALELGMADSLITKLAGLRQLVVRPTSAVRKYTALDQDPLAAGREQRVDAVLESSMQLSGERIRVTVRLLDVRDGSALWDYQCTEYCADVFAAQDAISRKVAEALALKLTNKERERLTKHYTENKEAYLLYQQGRFFAEKRTRESNQRAIEHYKQALGSDPNYALAYVGLADVYYVSSLTHTEKLSLSKAAAMKALAIDETLGEAHAALARILWQHEWDWTAAKKEFERALELDPNNAFAHRIHGYYLSSMGRHDEALAELKLAQHLDPLSLIINLDLGQTFYWAGEFDQALTQFRKTQEMDSRFVEAYHRLAYVYCLKGKYAEAIAELDKALALSRDNHETISLVGYTYALWGKKGEAVKRIEELQSSSKQKNVSALWIALIFTGLREKDLAFEWLHRACEERQGYLVFLKFWPEFQSLRADPRFADLLKCVGLPT